MRGCSLRDLRNAALHETGVLQIGLEEWETAQIRSNLTSEATPVPEEPPQKAPSRPRLSIQSFFGRFSSAPSGEQVAANKKLSRISVPLPRPSPFLEEGPELPADSPASESPATPQARLTSMAMQSKSPGVLLMKRGQRRQCDRSLCAMHLDARVGTMSEWRSGG